jgi:D-glycero-D-manno-heptose 1,7-bisphosphate phosphatase
MLLAAAREHDIDLERSFMIGDKAADVEAALAVGVTPILVLTGYGVEEQKDIPPATFIAQDVVRAVDWILG